MVNTPANSLSIKEARKLVLLNQGIHRPSAFGRGAKGTLSAIEHLGYVQIDTISVVERAHNHTLWNRNKSYSHKHLAQLQERGSIFEYWSHAAAFLPMRDFRFSLPRKKEYADGDTHWHAKDPKVAKRVLERIKSEGPLQARDFDEERVHQHAWGGMKPAKIALERLFIEGELMIAKREGFQKVFDLTERVLPTNVDTREPTQQELCEHLIRSYLRANGIGNPAHMAYLRKGLKATLSTVCSDLGENGELISVQVQGEPYYALPECMQALGAPLSQAKVVILSPFDNLLIQRKRMRSLFSFDYLIECYVTAAKRQYGYFSLPLLWGREFAGRLDAKIDRKSGILKLNHLALETKDIEGFASALRPSLHEFLDFNGGQRIEIDRISSAYSEHRQKDLEAFKVLLT
ncbi:MAG: hypothetical protein ACI9FR_000671 [Cryomorphaceae bacterium]